MKGVYPGTFDPLTNGHMDVIERAARLFDVLVVAVGFNPSKPRSTFLNVTERTGLLAEALRAFPNCRVASFDGLLVDFMRVETLSFVVRGLRALSDFEFELQMASMNYSLGSVETLFLPAREENLFTSSSFVREAFLLGADVSHMVPPCVWAHLTRRSGLGQNTR